MSRMMYKRAAVRPEPPAKRQKVAEPINLALQGIVNSLGDYVLRVMVNKAAVGLTLWINKKEESIELVSNVMSSLNKDKMIKVLSKEVLIKK